MYYNRLKDIRSDLDITQEDFAKIAGLSRGVYGRYERGIYPMPLDSLILIADAFDLSIDYIIGRSRCKRVSERILPDDRAYPYSQRSDFKVAEKRK